MPRANTSANKATDAKKRTVKKTDEIKEQQCELAPFTNNPHQTEYTKMMHRYADLVKERRQCAESSVSQTGCYLQVLC